MRLVNRRSIRHIGTGWLILFLLWLPFEDTQVWTSVALAIGLCAWLALRVLNGRNRWRTWAQKVGWGTLFGAAVPLLTLGLMAFKGGIHAHGFADFSARQAWTILSVIPICMAIGAGSAALLHIALLRREARLNSLN